MNLSEALDELNNLGSDEDPITFLGSPDYSLLQLRMEHPTARIEGPRDLELYLSWSADASKIRIVYWGRQEREGRLRPVPGTLAGMVADRRRGHTARDSAEAELAAQEKSASRPDPRPASPKRDLERHREVVRLEGLARELQDLRRKALCSDSPDSEVSDLELDALDYMSLAHRALKRAAVAAGKAP